MRVSGIIFDLDGTLLDTVPGLSRAMNEVLVAHQFPTHTDDKYKQYIGNGIHALVEQAVPAGQPPEVLETLYTEKSALYETYWKTGTSLYPGIADMLDDLSTRHIPLAICSNKEDHFTQQLVSHFLGNWSFFHVSGRTELIPKKPDPTGLLEIISKGPKEIEQWIYIGDKDADKQVSQNAGTDFAWASWGYQHEAPVGTIHTLQRPSDILTLV